MCREYKEKCRAFTLFHDKILSNSTTPNNTITQTLRKTYMSIGFFDWFETQEIITFDERIKYNGDLSKLYEYNEKLNKETSEYQSFHNVFGFINKDIGNGNIMDEDFWKEKDTDNPLKFVSFFQMEKNSEETFKKTKKTLESLVNEEKFIVYTTLDKNDLIVCIKSNKFKNVIDIINSLYNDLSKDSMTIIYSYTNLVVEYENIINNDKVNLDNILDEKIDSICIKTILNNKSKEIVSRPEKIKNFNNELSKSLYGYEEAISKIKQEQKEIVCYEILGDTDCRFIARNVKLSKVLSLYSKNGIFNRDHKLFRYSFLSSMTSLNLQYNDIYLDHEIEYDESLSLSPNAKKLQDDLLIIKNKINKLDELICKDYSSITSQLLQILNYVSYTNKQQAQRFEAELLINPLKIVVDILIQNIDTINNGNMDFDEIFNYVNNIYANIQSNMRADVRFFHISDFSVMSYYAPSKLRVLYSNIINLISRYYASLCERDKNLDYEFILTKTNNPITSVTQVWNDKIGVNKIMLVYMSERDLYNVKDFIIQLAHEVAHYVGNESVRKRKERFFLILEYLTSILYKDTIERLKTLLSDESSLYEEFKDNIINFQEFYEIFENKWCILIKQYIKKALNSRNIEQPEHFFYVQNLNKYIPDLFSNYDIRLEVTNYIFNDYIKKTREDMRQRNFNVGICRRYINRINDVKEYIKAHDLPFPPDIIIKNNGHYDFLISLMSESYSDMCAIILFDLTVDEYFQLIYSRIKDNSDYSLSSLFLRGCIVTKALADSYSSNGDNYNCSYYDIINSEKYVWSLSDDFKEKIISTCKNLMESSNRHITYYAYLYIKKCVCSYCDKVKPLFATDIIKKRDELRNFYRAICSESLTDSVQAINNIVENIK